MSNLELCGDRDLLLNVSEISLRMGKENEWTENFLHYLWSEKIICPVRYKTLASQFFWKKEHIELLDGITTEEWKDLKIPAFDPSKDYRSINLQFNNLINNKPKDIMPMKLEDEEKANASQNQNENKRNISVNIDDYLRDAKEKKKIDAYPLKKRRIKLKKFANWFGDKKYLSDLSSDSFQKFFISFKLSNTEIFRHNQTFESFLKWCQSNTLISNFENYIESSTKSKSKKPKLTDDDPVDLSLVSVSETLDILELKGRTGYHYLEVLETSEKLMPVYLPGLTQKRYRRSDLINLKKEISSPDGIDIISRSKAREMIGLTKQRAENLLDEWENEGILKPIILNRLKGKKYNRFELQALIEEKITNPSLPARSIDKQLSKSNKVNRIKDSETVASLIIRLTSEYGEALKELELITGKTPARLAQDALVYYIGVIKGDFSEDPKFLKVDKYAHELEYEKEPVYDF
jgi:hypothetical protein